MATENMSMGRSMSPDTGVGVGGFLGLIEEISDRSRALGLWWSLECSTATSGVEAELGSEGPVLGGGLVGGRLVVGIWRGEGGWDSPGSTFCKPTRGAGLGFFAPLPSISGRASSAVMA